jgi:hypothetical protein
MTTIEILPEITSEQTIYRAISGQQQATGATPGQALDQIEQVLSAQEEPPRGETLVILQRFRPDNLFSAQQQARLEELMEQFHQSVDTSESLPRQTQHELERLVEDEWLASIERSTRILEQTQPNQPSS